MSLDQTVEENVPYEKLFVDMFFSLLVLYSSVQGGYAHIKIVVALFVVKIFSFLIIASQGA